MHFTLSQAAKETGTSKSTISKALTTGRLSGDRLEGGSFRIEAAELFRVFPKKTLGTAFANGHVTVRELTEEIGERPDPEGPLLRFRVQTLEDQLAREREIRDQEREEHQETVRDLRKRLDQEQEERRNLQRQLAPPAPNTAPEKPREAPGQVEELRKRLEEAEARIATLGALERPQEAPAAAPGLVEPPKAARSGFLARLLGL